MTDLLRVPSDVLAQMIAVIEAARLRVAAHRSGNPK